jgi:hypothetical protein
MVLTVCIVHPGGSIKVEDKGQDLMTRFLRCKTEILEIESACTVARAWL